MELRPAPAATDVARRTGAMVLRGELRGAGLYREKRLTLLEQFGVAAASLMRVDVFLRLLGVHGMPTFGPFMHGRTVALF
jgi:hypothetical protein